jgi:hypothetical protein
MRSMASRWSDEDIAASLNRMGMRTGQGKTWTAHRVASLRGVHGIQSSDLRDERFIAAAGRKGCGWCTSSTLSPIYTVRPSSASAR